MSDLLVIDDEPEILRFIQRGLTAAGHSVTVTSDGSDGLRLVRQQQPHVVILDLVMPHVDGRSILSDLATSASASRVIVLSGMADIRTRVSCLEAGASDYLVKPFHMSELIARVHTQLRNDRCDREPKSLSVGRLILDLVNRSLHVDGRCVSLTNREFLLLRHMMSRQDEVCSREELLSAVWGYSFDPGTNVVDSCVRRLRSKMKSDAIDTVRNVGYSLRTA